MKIDALALSTSSDAVISGQPAKKKESSGKMGSGSNVDEVVQDSRNSKGLTASAVTYSPSLLKAASARNALYPLVAENNLNATNNNSPLPAVLLSRLNNPA